LHFGWTHIKTSAPDVHLLFSIFGIGLAKQIKNSKPMKFKLIGFISDDTKIKHHHLMGTKVYAPDLNTIRKMRNNNISTLLISPGAINVFRANKDFQDALLAEGIHIYMPTTQEWNRNEQQQLKEVSIEDLLPRDEISIDMESVGAMLHGKRILITGSAGSIGSEMVRQIAKYSPAELILIDSAETPQHDIRLMMAKQFPDIKAETIVTTICSKSRMEHIFKTYLQMVVTIVSAFMSVNCFAIISRMSCCGVSALSIRINSAGLYFAICLTISLPMLPAEPVIKIRFP
jgi:FlaA1/EpsC-like NDP-sugar epimerase